MEDKDKSSSKYDGKPIKFLDKKDHYELIFMDFFKTVSNEKMENGIPIMADLLMDMKEADHSKEIHVFVGSYGGEVCALNMLLQQLLLFPHRVGISVGWACSCGWMLLFSCQERYLAPFSMNCFHSMSSLAYGKVEEMKNMNKFDEEWWKILLSNTDTSFLTEEEKKLAETSEVYLTGEELISRGACKDYREYAMRSIPQQKTSGVYEVGRALYVKNSNGMYDKYRRISSPEISWEKLVEIYSKDMK